jgi:hypothetical protein
LYIIVALLRVMLFSARNRWSSTINKTDLLVLSAQHLFFLPPTTWRPAVAAYIYMTHILPVLRLLISLEEDPELFAAATVDSSLSQATAAANRKSATATATGMSMDMGDQISNRGFEAEEEEGVGGNATASTRFGGLSLIQVQVCYNAFSSCFYSVSTSYMVCFTHCF